MRTLRWVMVAGTLAIAAVLLLRGNYILGLLIGGLAIVRVVYMVTFARRRRAFRSSYGAGVGAGAGAHGAGPVRELLRGLARAEFPVAAGIIGMDPAQVRTAFEQGRSLAELATGAGVPVERVVNGVASDAAARIDQGVADGRVPEERALQAKAQLPVWANRLVNFHKGDFQRTRGWT
ncbi:MAG: hypothetical protein ABSD78_12850 [Acidimicrobiales bacterium]